MEAQLDIKQSERMSNLLKEQTQILANDRFTITPRDLYSAFIRKYGIKNNRNDDEIEEEEEEKRVFDDCNDGKPAVVDWTRFGEDCASIFLTVHGSRFLNGALFHHCIAGNAAIEQPKKKYERKKRRNFDAEENQVHPTQITKASKATRTETRSRVAHMQKLLKQKCASNGKSIEMMPFCFNPQSFSQTVENLFDLSFLVKEGRVAMSIDSKLALDDQQPMLTYISKAEKIRRQDLAKQMTPEQQKLIGGQCIFKIDPLFFYSMIKNRNITQTQIDRNGVYGSDDDDDEEQENKNSENVSEEQLEDDYEKEREDVSGFESYIDDDDGSNERMAYIRDRVQPPVDEADRNGKQEMD